MKELTDFILHGEGLRLKPYLCSANRPTIGIGNTFYKDGRAVKMTDKPITKEEAYALAEFVILDFATHVKKCLTHEVNKHQFTALVSFCYNVGKGAFSKSILLKTVNINPNDPAIKNIFPISFVTAAGKPCRGLVIRRRDEAKKYFQ